MSEPWKCYFLATCDAGSQKTYIGVTPDLSRRLRQHNGEFAGGAKATAGRLWERIGHVTGFPDHRAALQFEWRWKQISRRIQGPPLEKRLKALLELLSIDRPTTTAVPYSEYVDGPEFIVETTRELPAV